MTATRGFTLIELLVVITIIALLSAALLPNITLGLDATHKACDRLKLQKHYQRLQVYRQQHGHLPTGEGHEFVLAPWVEGTIERTETNRDEYFSEARQEDPHRIAVVAQPIDSIWRDYASVSSKDTHFAGRARDGRGRMSSGREIWMATDNEGGNTYRDGSVLMLFGDGSVRELTRAKQRAFGAPADPGEEFTMPVGAESPHPDLRKLRQ